MVCGVAVVMHFTPLRTLVKIKIYYIYFNSHYRLTIDKAVVFPFRTKDS